MVIIMRMYYVFELKDDIVSLYKSSPVSLFKILNSIYYMQKEEIDYGFSIFKQLNNKIDVSRLNNHLYILLHKDLVYSKIDDEHIINDLYNDEVSILKVRNSHIIIQSNKSYTSFLKILYNYNKNYFVCDFKEKDFFFIGDIVKYEKVRWSLTMF